MRSTKRAKKGYRMLLQNPELPSTWLWHQNQAPLRRGMACRLGHRKLRKPFRVSITLWPSQCCEEAGMSPSDDVEQSMSAGSGLQGKELRMDSLHLTSRPPSPGDRLQGDEMQG